MINTTGGAVDLNSNHSDIFICLCVIIAVSKELKGIGKRVGMFQICQFSKIDDRL